MNTLIRPSPRARVLAAIFVLATTAVVHRGAADGNPPERLSYQGYLVDPTGSPLGDAAPKNYDIVFRVYNHETGTGAGYRLWTEFQTVTVDKGYFTAVLGEGAAYSSEARPSLSTLFTNLVDVSDRFIEMTVRGIGVGGTDSTVLPRLRLLSSPFCFLATRAVNANNLVNPASQQVVTVTGTNVGVNCTSPTSALEVNGTLKATALEVGGAITAPSVTGTTVAGTTVTGTTITASAGFVGPGSVPLGTIVMWSGTAAPSGWALCDGQTYNGRQTPDLRGRFILGSGSGTGLTPRTTGQAGGEETHTLTVSEMPAHPHAVDPPSTSTTSDTHDHSFSVYGGAFGNGASAAALYTGYPVYGSRTTSSDTHHHSVDIPSFNSSSAGGGGAHNNIPPFYVLAFIMRVQ